MKQHVLLELDQFLKAVTDNHDSQTSLTSTALIRSSLRLLEDLPAAREILFDYFAMVYDMAVHNYVTNATNIDPQTGLPPVHSKSGASNAQSQQQQQQQQQQLEDDADDGYVLIQQALENLVNKGPSAWSPEIAAWSLHLAARLSDKHTKRKMGIIAACNYWLNSGAMCGLLTLISSGFRKLNSEETESCVETILAAFERYSLTFDWVVARLGGCFPLKIITQILQCALKRFVEDPRCRFDSEIGIMDYLAFAHEQELRVAFRDMLRDGFQPKKTLDASIIPFLLVICNYSEVLLQNLVNVFLELYNNELLATIVQKAPLWMSNKMFAEMQPSLNNVALRLNTNGTKLFFLVAKLAETYSWCQDFLEFSLQELEQVILNARLCPLLKDLSTEESKDLLWKYCLSTNIFEQQTAVRLLLIISTQHFHIYFQTISELLRKSYTLNTTGIGAVLRLLGGHSGVVEFPEIKPGLKMVFTDVFLQEQFTHYRPPTAETTSESLNTFRNLATLTKLEKKNFLPFLKQQSLISALNACLPQILQILDVILEKLELQMDEDAAEQLREKFNASSNAQSAHGNNYNNNNGNTNDDKKCSQNLKIDYGDNDNDVNGSSNDDDYDDDEEMAEDELEIDEETIRKGERATLAHAILDLLHTIEAGSKASLISTTEVLKLAALTVKYFFFSLTEKDPSVRTTAVNRAFNLLQRQCSARKAARSVCLRELVEGALFHYGYLFGQHVEPEIDDLAIPEHEMVIVQNQRLSSGPSANRNVLHAGVIGRGLRPKEGKGAAPNDDHNCACQCDANMQTLLLKALDACCEDADKKNIIEGYSMISLLLVELISTDVMYNGLPFPDEEFTKVTIERDLAIRRSFSTLPILWGLLGFIAMHRPALCFSSVLLRALCATCLHQWRARNVNKYKLPNPNDELLQCTKRLLQVMAMGQLLPPPLSNLHMIIEHFDAPEIALLLKECIWNYMKDHVPSPALYHSDSNGLHWRNASLAKIPPQYVDTLRNLMQKKLPKLGQHYHQMFIMHEMNLVTSVKAEEVTPNGHKNDAMDID